MFQEIKKSDKKTEAEIEKIIAGLNLNPNPKTETELNLNISKILNSLGKTKDIGRKIALRKVLLDLLKRKLVLKKKVASSGNIWIKLEKERAKEKQKKSVLNYQQKKKDHALSVEEINNQISEAAELLLALEENPDQSQDIEALKSEIIERIKILYKELDKELLQDITKDQEKKADPSKKNADQLVAIENTIRDLAKELVESNSGAEGIIDGKIVGFVDKFSNKGKNSKLKKKDFSHFLKVDPTAERRRDETEHIYEKYGKPKKEVGQSTERKVSTSSTLRLTPGENPTGR